MVNFILHFIAFTEAHYEAQLAPPVLFDPPPVELIGLPLYGPFPLFESYGPESCWP